MLKKTKSQKKKPLVKVKSKALRSKKSEVIFNYLQPGDVIDIVAPGSPCSQETFDNSVQWIKNQGFEAHYPEDILAPDLFLSNTDEKRTKYLLEALTNCESKAVWCLRGGYGALRLWPQLEKIKKLPRPKFFIGYSDITTIHQWLNQKMHWPTIHGPLLDRCGDGRLSEAEKNELLGLLTGTKKEIFFQHLKPVNASAVTLMEQNKKIKSTLRGGNLTVYCSSLGTTLSPMYHQKDRFFLFLEEIAERGYRVDRMLTQLKLAGGFEKCQAVFLGDFVGGQEISGENYVWPVIEKFFKDFKIPVWKGLHAGHGQSQRPVIFNAEAQVFCGPETHLVLRF